MINQYLIVLIVFVCHFLGAQENIYRLRYGDILNISVYGEEHTAREVKVGPDGMINYLYINSIPASGRTIAEVRQNLTDKLKAFYKYPLLNIVPTHFGAEYY